VTRHGWSGRFLGPLKELSNLGLSWSIISVVIIAIDKTRVLGFALIPIINRWCFGFLSLRSIFILPLLTLSFFGFIFADGGRLNRFYLRSLVGERGRRQSILNIRRNRFGVVVQRSRRNVVRHGKCQSHRQLHEK
jgi:hypothetical protein